MLYIAHRSFAPYGQGYKTRQNQHKLFARLQPSCSDVFFTTSFVGYFVDCGISYAGYERERDVVFEKFNAAVPDDLKASKVFACEKNPNLQAKVVCADFVFNTPYRQIKVGDKFEISYEKKGEIVTENVASKIFSFFEKDGKLVARLASGSVNLRPDRILQKLNEILGEDLKLCDVEKVAQYVDVDGKLVEVDRYLQK